MGETWHYKVRFMKLFLRVIAQRDNLTLSEDEINRCAPRLIPYMNLSGRRWDLTLDSTNTRIVRCTLKTVKYKLGQHDG